MPTDDVFEAIDRYCSRLRRALHKVPPLERDEIVEEVRGHIIERIEAQAEANHRVLAEILEAVGDPKKLASEYETQVRSNQPTTRNL